MSMTDECLAGHNDQPRTAKVRVAWNSPHRYYCVLCGKPLRPFVCTYCGCQTLWASVDYEPTEYERPL